MIRIPRFTQCVAVSCALVGIPCGIAAAEEPPNGDFETGFLPPWDGRGDAGVSTENVLQGAFSGFLTTGANAVGGVCSSLNSAFVFPPTDRARVKVAFKVRYKTDETVGPFSFFEDPFHAQFVTAKGTVDLLTIKTDGIFWTKGDPTETEVDKFRSPPKIPPFEPGVLFASETPTLPVRSEIKLKGCDPVQIKFQICDWGDEIVDSAAFVDAVKFRFEEDGDKCTEDMIDPGIMQGIEQFPPASRER
jgi:hypothetical protein